MVGLQFSYTLQLRRHTPFEMAKTKTTKRKRSDVGIHSKNNECRFGSKDIHDDSMCTCSKRRKVIMKDAFSQTEHIVGSYHRGNDKKMMAIMTYEQLRAQILTDHETLFQWCIDNNLIASKRICYDCGRPMKLKPTRDGRSDRWLWRCRRRVGEGKEIIKETSIRQDSVFEDSNLTIAEILQFIYWWSIGLTQSQILVQMRMSSATTCAWHTKCREICDYIVMQHPQMIGGNCIENFKVRIVLIKATDHVCHAAQVCHVWWNILTWFHMSDYNHF